MQVAAGVQGYRCVCGVQVSGGLGSHDVLLDMAGGQVVMLAQLGATGDQCRVVFQAGQLLARLQQATAEVALAGAPVEPVLGRAAEGEAGGEGFDLLPLASGHVDVEALAGGRQRGFVEGSDSAQCSGFSCERRKWRRGGKPLRVVVAGFGLFEAALAQPGGEFRVLAFPWQMQMGEGTRAPKRLVDRQERIQGLEAGVQGGALEDERHAGGPGCQGWPLRG